MINSALTPEVQTFIRNEVEKNKKKDDSFFGKIKDTLFFFTPIFTINAEIEELKANKLKFHNGTNTTRTLKNQVSTQETIDQYIDAKQRFLDQRKFTISLKIASVALFALASFAFLVFPNPVTTTFVAMAASIVAQVFRNFNWEKVHQFTIDSCLFQLKSTCESLGKNTWSAITQNTLDVNFNFKIMEAKKKTLILAAKNCDQDSAFNVFSKDVLTHIFKHDLAERWTVEEYAKNVHG